jgi:hypothetical protein
MSRPRANSSGLKAALEAEAEQAEKREQQKARSGEGERVEDATASPSSSMSVDDASGAGASSSHASNQPASSAIKSPTPAEPATAFTGEQLPHNVHPNAYAMFGARHPVQDQDGHRQNTYNAMYGRERSIAGGSPLKSTRPVAVSSSYTFGSASSNEYYPYTGGRLHLGSVERTRYIHQANEAEARIGKLCMNKRGVVSENMISDLNW